MSTTTLNVTDTQDDFAEAFFPTVRLHNDPTRFDYQHIVMRTTVKMVYKAVDTPEVGFDRLNSLSKSAANQEFAETHVEEQTHVDCKRILSWILPTQIQMLETPLGPRATDINKYLNAFISKAVSKRAVDAIQTVINCIYDPKEYWYEPGWIAGRHLIKPTYVEEKLQVDSVMLQDTLKCISNMVDALYAKSGYEAAAMSLDPTGVGNRPDVVIGCGPTMHKLLTIQADKDRITLPNGFRALVVSSTDDRMEDAIIVTLSVFNETRNTEPNPLSFGVLAWQDAELNSRVADNDRYKIVEHQPILRCQHLVNMPVIGQIIIERK